MRSLAAIALAACAVAAPAAAQQNYGRPLDTPENRGAMALRFSSRCAVNEVPASARKVLDTPVASPEEAKRVKVLIGLARKCYQPQWPSFPPTLVRGAIAESFYLEAYRAAPPATIVAAAPPASFGVAPPGAKGTPEQEVSWTLAAVANCVVFVDATGVRNLLLGPAGVPEEDKRFAALAPAVGKCIAASQAAALKPMPFRGYLADALYRRARGVAS